MIRFKPRIERMYWNQLTPERLGSYLKELKQEKEKLKKLTWDMKDFISEDWVNQMQRAIESEIEYHEFYFELRKKKKSLTFKKWRFIKGHKDHEWNQPKDRWEITNGKIKIVIEIEEKKSTYITLIIENDSNFISNFIKFLPDGRRKELSTKILRNPEKIKEYIDELKSKSEEIFEEYKRPRYNEEQNNINYLNEILEC